MNKIIKKIVVQHFRSLQNQSIECDEVNIISGLNDSGKSTILKALNFFFNGQTDFLTPIDFQSDFCKISLAKAQKSNKQRQLIKVKIYFNPPSSFKLLQQEKEVFVEKIIDRYGIITTEYSSSNSKVKTQISKLLSKIKYFYIPALKGDSVFHYLLGHIGEEQLITQDDISGLEQTINSKLKDLTEILAQSNIQNQAKLDFPLFTKDFLSKSTLNTNYDYFDTLQSNIENRKKNKEDVKLNINQYKIPLSHRGEGIKSKFIPPLLQWMQKHNPKYSYVWGIDEPENSLEFKKAEELAHLYLTEYRKHAQLFLTTHSFAFIFPQIEQQRISFLRTTRNKLGATQIQKFSGLFKESDKIQSAEELGILEVQKKLYMDWRNATEQMQQQSEEIQILQKATRPLICVEGPSDEIIIKNAWNALYSQPFPFDIQNGEGVNYSFNFTTNPICNKLKRTTIFVWDCDEKAFCYFLGLDKRGFVAFNQLKHIKKHHSCHRYVLLLPAPDSRANYVNLSSERAQLQFLSIEHYFSDELLKKYKMIASEENNICFLTENSKLKMKFADATSKFKKEDFKNFVPLFEHIKKLVNNSQKTTSRNE